VGGGEGSDEGIMSKNTKRFLSIVKWKNHAIDLKEKVLLNKSVISKYLSMFWKEKIDTIPDIKDKHILILFRVKTEDGQYLTIGQLQRNNCERREMVYLIDYLTNILSLKANYYTSTPITEVIFSYGIRKGNVEAKQRFVENKAFQRYNGYKIPASMDPLNYGKLIRHRDSEFLIQVNKNNMVIINQTLSPYSLLINQVQFFSGGDLILEFTDTAINSEATVFERVIGKNKFIFSEGVLALSTVHKKTKNLSRLRGKRKD
jgi:hypothetical protein